MTGFRGVLFANEGLDGVVVGFLGDGVGGSTLGSFDRNDLIGVLGLVVVVGRWVFIGIGLIIEGDMLSSGNCPRFNRRRTSYH